ncbi:MAG: hypothetical protein EAZ95_16890 [Bacteroidetes bacterium]|nr:MAG: hypothetical protein EAZ95_16890 [Bacteroidota bacterium]
MKLQAFHAALGEDSQVYSPDEQTQTFGMFDKTPDEGRDEKIAYLMQIREFKQNNPDLFAQIKKMPLRARVGRQGQLAKDCTVAFIRDKKRDAFIRVLANGKVEELSFLEIVKSFEAKPEEQGVPLLASHHTHIQKAIAHFALQQEADKARDLKVDYTQGPNEKKATAYLEVFLPLPFLTVQDKQLLRLGITAIQQGRFQNLQRDINKLQNSVKKTPLKPEVLAQKIMKILDSYPLVQQQTPQEPTPDELPQTTKPNKKPQIIISESFA